MGTFSILAAALLAAQSTAMGMPGADPEAFAVTDPAAPSSLDPRYKACVAAVEADPEEGRRAALRWITDGGGDPAMHCAAVADIAVGLPRVGARRLTSLAERAAAADPGLAARLYAQAALAWANGHEETQALAAIDAAYALVPNAPELHLMAASVYAGIERWGHTKRVLDLAAETAPLNSQALALRGKAKQMLADYEGAAKDVQLALNLDPENIQALILRGELVQAGYAIDPVRPQ